MIGLPILNLCFQGIPIASFCHPVVGVQHSLNKMLIPGTQRLVLHLYFTTHSPPTQRPVNPGAMSIQKSHFSPFNSIITEKYSPWESRLICSSDRATRSQYSKPPTQECEEIKNALLPSRKKSPEYTAVDEMMSTDVVPIKTEIWSSTQLPRIHNVTSGPS